MQGVPNTQFDDLMVQLSALPLWVKQVIYAQMRQDLEATLSSQTLEAFGPEHTLQLWIPELTHLAHQELEKRSGQVDQSTLKMLYLARLNKNVLTITILNGWSLEQAAIFLLQAIQKELVAPPRSLVISGTIDYLAGRIRLGEYLVKINRLSLEQLDQGLRTQKAIEEAMGERTGIANVLINLGYIKKEDSEAILFLKNESKKPFPGLKQILNSSEQQVVAQLQAQLQQAIQRIRQLEAKPSEF